jgi:hypothetical protein
MHVFAILAVAAVFTGCSSLPKRSSANFSTVEARMDAARRVANPEARAHIIEAERQLKAAKDACLASASDLEQAIKERNEAVAETRQWKEKQRKALRELWFWRGALIVSVLFAARGPILWLVRKFLGIPW